jgi:hypothetical protein
VTVRAVIIESPYQGTSDNDEIRAAQRANNVRYARRALRDSLLRGEAPFASHLLYTQRGVLDDLVPEQREHGIAAGLALGLRADATVVYVDRGMSDGMAEGIRAAEKAGRPVEWRSLAKSPEEAANRATQAAALWRTRSEG